MSRSFKLKNVSITHLLEISLVKKNSILGCHVQ